MEPRIPSSQMNTLLTEIPQVVVSLEEREAMVDMIQTFQSESESASTQNVIEKSFEIVNDELLESCALIPKAGIAQNIPMSSKTLDIPLVGTVGVNYAIWQLVLADRLAYMTGATPLVATDLRDHMYVNRAHMPGEDRKMIAPGHFVITACSYRNLPTYEEFGVLPLQTPSGYNLAWKVADDDYNILTNTPILIPREALVLYVLPIYQKYIEELAGGNSAIVTTAQLTKYDSCTAIFAVPKPQDSVDIGSHFEKRTKFLFHRELKSWEKWIALMSPCKFNEDDGHDDLESKMQEYKGSASAFYKISEPDVDPERSTPIVKPRFYSIDDLITGMVSQVVEADTEATEAGYNTNNDELNQNGRSVLRKLNTTDLVYLVIHILTTRYRKDLQVASMLIPQNQYSFGGTDFLVNPTAETLMIPAAVEEALKLISAIVLVESQTKYKFIPAWYAFEDRNSAFSVKDPSYVGASDYVRFSRDLNNTYTFSSVQGHVLFSDKTISKTRGNVVKDMMRRWQGAKNVLKKSMLFTSSPATSNVSTGYITRLVTFIAEYQDDYKFPFLHLHTLASPIPMLGSMKGHMFNLLMPTFLLFGGLESEIGAESMDRRVQQFKEIYFCEYSDEYFDQAFFLGGSSVYRGTKFVVPIYTDPRQDANIGVQVMITQGEGGNWFISALKWVGKGAKHLAEVSGDIVDLLAPGKGATVTSILNKLSVGIERILPKEDLLSRNDHQHQMAIASSEGLGSSKLKSEKK